MEKEEKQDEMKELKKKKSKSETYARASKRNTILLSILILLVASIGVYAWFSVSNRARIENLALIADHQGNLLIADDTGNGPGTYSDALDAATATGADEQYKNILSPVTTTDGKTFYAPVYNSLTNTVDSVEQITDMTELKQYYIYEKSFYLKAGSSNDSTVAKIARTYDIALYGIASGERANGSYIVQNSTNGDTAARAIRISFTLDDGSTYIYEPNYGAGNSDTNRANDGVGDTYGRYTTYQQYESGAFVNSPKTNESEKLFTIDENVDVRVTMRIWIEGTDADCTNSIASDMVSGQIMFISTENKS